MEAAPLPEAPINHYQAITTAANCTPIRNGKIRAICECCGQQSRPVLANDHGEPDLWNMARGWSEAPFPHNFKHRDGSIGSTFTCPGCNKKLHAGMELQLRRYLLTGQPS